MLVTFLAPERNDGGGSEGGEGGDSGNGGGHAGDGAAAVAGGGSGGKLRVRVEVTLTGVCHCPRQIISSGARYTPTPLPPSTANLPQNERPAVEVACVYPRVHAPANWCSCRLFVLCIRVDTYIPTPHHHYEGMVVRCTFSRSTHSPRGVVLLYTSRRYFATAFPSSPPSSSSL